MRRFSLVAPKCAVNLIPLCSHSSSYCLPLVRKEGNVLFKDALNTFYLQLYDVGHMVKDCSDSKRGNPLTPLHGVLFPISTARSLLYAPPHKQDSTYHGLCYTSHSALKSLQWTDGTNSCWRVVHIIKLILIQSDLIKSQHFLLSPFRMLRCQYCRVYNYILSQVNPCILCRSTLVSSVMMI